MAKLTDEMKELVKNQPTIWATINADGMPNLGPKGSTHVLDDEHLVFYEFTGKHHWGNLQRDPRIVAATVDAKTYKGFRFVGTAEIIASGPLYDKSLSLSEKMKIPPAKAVVKVKVNEIYSLSFPGAGKKLA